MERIKEYMADPNKFVAEDLDSHRAQFTQEGEDLAKVRTSKNKKDSFCWLCAWKGSHSSNATKEHLWLYHRGYKVGKE